MPQVSTVKNAGLWIIGKQVQSLYDLVTVCGKYENDSVVAQSLKRYLFGKTVFM